MMPEESGSELALHQSILRIKAKYADQLQLCPPQRAAQLKRAMKREIRREKTAYLVKAGFMSRISILR